MNVDIFAACLFERVFYEFLVSIGETSDFARIELNVEYVLYRADPVALKFEI